MVNKQKNTKHKDTSDSDLKTEKKINSLFERTADEIFYDFFKKNGKILSSALVFLLLCILYGTYQYNQNSKYEQRTSDEIIAILDGNWENVNDKINKYFEYEHRNLASLKEKHQASLLYLFPINSKHQSIFLYKKAKELPYVCQYPFTTYHFKKLVVVEELLYLKVLYFLGFYGYKKEMKEFFLEKKMQTSVFAYYANYLLAIFTEDNNILKELIVGYGGFITNSRKEFVYYTTLSSSSSNNNSSNNNNSSKNKIDNKKKSKRKLENKNEKI
jgi:hypothetical protein